MVLPLLRPPNLITSGGSSAGTGFSTRVSSRQSQNQPASQNVCPVGRPFTLQQHPSAHPSVAAARGSASAGKAARAVAPHGSSAPLLVPPAELLPPSTSRPQGDVGSAAAAQAQERAPFQQLQTVRGASARKTTLLRHPIQSPPQVPVPAPAVEEGDGTDADSGSRHNNSAAAQQALEGLPLELHCLLDPSAAVSLPVPGSLSALDNSKLDRLVAALGRGRATWRRVLLLYEWLKASRHSMDDRLCTTLIRVCADHGDAVSALSVYEWMRAPLAAGGAALQPTAYTYTAAMRAALGVGMLDRAMQVWNDSQAADLSPDCRLCITYIEVCTRLGWADHALAMYTQMRDAPLGSPMRPSVHAYTAAMRAATEGRQWTRALQVWEDLRRSGCQPTGHAYAAAISACAAGQDWARAVALFDDMTSRSGIRPDVVSCTALISALAAAGEADKAEAVVFWMQKSGLKPNVRTYTSLLTAMGNACQWQRAIRLLFAMQLPENGNVQPNAYTYSALLKALGQHGQWQLAEEVFGDLESQVHASRVAQATSSSLPSSWSSSSTPLPPSSASSPDAPHQAASRSDSGAATNGQDDALVAPPRLSAAEAARRAVAFNRLMALATKAEAQQQQQPPGALLGLAQAQAMAVTAAAAATAALQQQFGGDGGGPGTPTLAGLPADASAALAALAASSSATVGPNAAASAAAAATTAAAMQQAWQQQAQQQEQQLLDLAAQQLLAGAGVPGPQQPLTPAPSGLGQAHSNGWQLPATAAMGGGARPASFGIPALASSSWSSGGMANQQQQQQPPTRSWLHPSELNGIQLHLHHSPLPPQLPAEPPPGSSWAPSGFVAGLPGSPADGAAMGQGGGLWAAAAPALPAPVPGPLPRWTSPLDIPPTTTPGPVSTPGGGAAAAFSSLLPSLLPRAPLGGETAQNRQLAAPPALGPATAASLTAASPPLVNDVVCAALMSAYERAGKWVEAVNVLSRARLLGVEPSAGMVAVAVSAAGRAGQLEVAEQLFGCLPVPDHAACEALLSACGVAGRPDKAEQLLRTMQRRGMRPRDVAYCALVTAHSVAGCADTALGVRRRMAREGCQPSVHVYNALLAACDRAGRYEHALELLQAMKVEGVEPNGTTHHLMAVVGRHGVQTVESQQVAAAALSAVFAAAGGLMIRAGMF